MICRSNGTCIKFENMFNTHHNKQQEDTHGRTNNPYFHAKDKFGEDKNIIWQIKLCT